MAPKTVLITGCSAGGIGSALAIAFAAHDFHVFATVRTLSKASHLAGNPSMTILPLDVISASSISACVATVTSRVAEMGCHGLDVLVNNSGRGYVIPALDADMEEARKVFDVNFWGVLAVTQAFSPLLLEAKGTILNIGSVVGECPGPLRSIYNASKAAANSLSETMRLELAPFGVNVVTAITGLVESNLATNLQDFHLPAKSLYLPIKKEIEAQALEKPGVLPSKMALDVYAERVVNDVLGGATGLIWRGGMATAIRFGSKLLPMWIWDMAKKQNTGLDRLAGLVKSN